MLSPFHGLEIVTVETDTEIEHEGETETVTDTNAVFKGRKIYVTERVFEMMKRHAKEGQK